MTVASHYAHHERDQVTSRLFFAAIVVLTTFFFSGQALIALGQDYMLGSEPEKIHPATYLATLFLLIQFFSAGQRRVIGVVTEFPGPVYLVISVIVLTFYVALFLSVPAANLPDTWLLPAMTFVLCAQLNRAEATILRITLDVVVAINSVVAIGEIVLDKRIIPLSIASAQLGQYLYPIEWRASAFLGHPLTGAYTTGCYILLLIFDRRIRLLSLRLPLLLLHVCALLAYGSRAAMVLLGLTLVMAFAWSLMTAAITRKVPKDVLVYGALLAPVVILGVPAILATGIANRFIDRFSVDHGSADGRAGMLEMFNSFSWSDIVLGPPKSLIEALGIRFRVGSGIESFWLGFLFTFGIVGCVIFMPSLYVFCRDLVRRTGAHAVPVLLYFFACCTTSVSLSSRSLELAYVVGFLLSSRHLQPLSTARMTAPRTLPRLAGHRDMGLPVPAALSHATAADAGGGSHHLRPG